MSKKDNILKKNKLEEYPLNESEILQIASLTALIKQSQMAQDQLYSLLLKNITDRYEISNKTVELNWSEIMDQGAKFAKLIVKD